MVYAVALVMALAVMIAWTKLAPQNIVAKVAAAVVLIPVLYWLIGPLVLKWHMAASAITNSANSRATGLLTLKLMSAL